MRYKNYRLLAIVLILIIQAMCVQAAFVNIQGWIFYHNGTAVPTGTDVNLTQTSSGWKGVTTTGGAQTNYYFFIGVQANDDGSDVFNIFSWEGIYNGSNSDNGLGWVTINVTYDNIPPRWTSNIPDFTMDEDNSTGIDNAVNLSDYAFDYDGSPMTYSIFSQSNSALVSASIDGEFLDIGIPTADQNGASTVCVRANDGEDSSVSDCFTITVNAVPDDPSFTSGTDNVTSMLKGGTTIRVSSTASDVDGDTVTLYVCTTTGVNSGGCTGSTRCSATAASDPSCTFSAESDDSDHSWYAFVYDATGRKAASNYTDNYSCDSTAPVAGTVTLENGATYHASTSVLTAWSGYSDVRSGIHWYYYSFTDNSGTRTGNQIANTSSGATISGASQGNNSVYVWAEDTVGNIGNDANDWIWVDTEAPLLYDWQQSPSDVDQNTATTVTVTVRVNDTTWNTSDPPDFRYKYGSGSWSSYAAMTSVAGNQYTYTIPIPTGGWTQIVLNYLYYEVDAVDVLSWNKTEMRSDYIEVFNYPPNFTNIPDMTVYENTNFSINLSATDADGDALTFASTGNFTITQLTNTTAVAWWVPNYHYLGSNTFTFNVTDGIDTRSQSVIISVTGINDAPVLESVGNLEAYLHVPFIKYIYGWDPDNKNSDILDNNVLIFDIAENYRWFHIDSYFNVSNESYYGVINFTPLLSHRGTWNLTLYVTDGYYLDKENITFTVGYCGDLDAGGEPYCDSTYEDCSSCPTDCGKCSSSEEEKMAIIIDPRNCLGRNFTIWTYSLWDRATCPTEGLIVGGLEVCENLSGVNVDILKLQNKEWTSVDQYISDDNGQITLTIKEQGEYKLVGEKRGLPKAFEYLEIEPCIIDEKENTTITSNNNEQKEAEVEKPQAINDTQQKDIPENIPDAGWLSIMLWLIIPVTMVSILSIVGVYYYSNHKNDNAYILKARIWTKQKTIRLKKLAYKYYKKMRAYMGYK